jgi:DNA-binding response OmpR family regulator
MGIMKVLIIEDNKELAQNIKDYLLREGYRCELSFSFKEAEDKIISFSYDCIILDIMLPDGNGLQLLKLIRSAKNESSVLIVSAKNALDDKIQGLDLGADDYITKPFHLPELHSRLKAIYRRKFLRGDNTITLHEISVNADTMEAKVNETPLDLTKKEFDLLLYFLINKNRVLTRQSIEPSTYGATSPTTWIILILYTNM